jgi:sugar O-acyltransferase (sialic acid O-acetyltransferase NeuD family)
MKRLIIIGAGGHARSIAEIVLDQGGYALAGFLDDAYPGVQSLWEFPVLGKVDALAGFRGVADAVFVAIGNNRVRESLFHALSEAGFELPNLIHARAIVSSRAVLWRGVAIMAGAIVGTEAVLGDGVIVNAGAVVDHHARVEDFGHLGVNASMAGGSRLGRGAWMQAGAALGYGVEIDAGQVLEPGAGLAKIARLDAPAERQVRRVGLMSGQIAVPDDFDRMGGREIERLFGDSE